MQKETLIILIIFVATIGYSQNCVNFEGNPNYLSNWKDNGKIYSKSIVVETPQYLNKCLRLVDGQGASIAYNDVDFTGNWITKYNYKCLCFDFKVNYDNTVEPQNNYAPKIIIYSGNNPQNGNNWSANLVFATFISSNNINIDNQWYNYCLPIGFCQNGALPSNQYGQWVINSPDACQIWNSIIQNVKGIIIPTDYNGMPSEMVYLDNFCATTCSSSQSTSSGCCPYLLNTLPTHPGPISGYTYDGSATLLNSLIPGEYTIINSSNASNICSQWNICPSNGDVMLFNGKTGQVGKSTIWQRNVNLQTGRQYKFCAKFKNLPQCCFDVKPKIDIIFSASGNDILGEVVDENALDPCKWKEISQNLSLTSTTGSMTIKILLDESTQGDGNDLVIDDIAFYELPQSSSAFSLLTITPTPLYNNKYSITALANNPVPEPDCGYFWEVCEIDLSTNDCAPSSKVSNPSNWWIGSSTPNTFLGYQGSSTLGGSSPGRFFTGKTYQVSLGTYCTCLGWNQTFYRFKYDAVNGFTSWKL